MEFIEQKNVLNMILNNEDISTIWVLDPNSIKGTQKQIADGCGYLIFKQVNVHMTIADIKRDGLIFIKM